MYPVINLEKFRYSSENSRKYVTFINPIKSKGAEIFVKIANLMPNQQFLVVGGAYAGFIDKVKKLENVTYKPWLNDMREVYTNTEILLVPSIWEEPFGRVVLEAQINGIPVISSKRGGLPEAVGEGGVVVEDFTNADRWIEAIEDVRNHKNYDKYSKEAKKHGEMFTSEKQMKLFSDMLMSLFK
jgi:glycosyltransferase involved in cell wall biosynthesis